MTPRFVFHRAARDELREARDWYESQHHGLGDELGEVVSAAIARIGEFPEMYPEVLPGLRRAVLSRFPYALLYRNPDSFSLNVRRARCRRGPCGGNGISN